MFDVTPKFLALLQKTPTSELKASLERAVDALEETTPAKLEELQALWYSKFKSSITLDELRAKVETFCSEIRKVLRARGCTL